MALLPSMTASNIRSLVEYGNVTLKFGVLPNGRIVGSSRLGLSELADRCRFPRLETRADSKKSSSSLRACLRATLAVSRRFPTGTNRNVNKSYGLDNISASQSSLMMKLAWLSVSMPG